MTVSGPNSAAGFSDVLFRWHSDIPVVVSLHLSGFPGTTVHGGIEMTIEEPGVYAATVQVPNDMCVSYGFLVFDSVEAQQELSIYQVLDSLVEDPRNRDVIRRPFGMGGSASVLQMPDARRHPAWPEPDRHGEHRDQAVCVVAASGRDLTVLRGVREGPLLVMFDGDLLADKEFGYLDAMATRNASATGPSPTVVLVSTPDRAILDKRTVMAQLLTDEILPALERDGIGWSGIIVAGQSYGGLAAAGLLVDLPDLVDAAIVQSGSFWFDGTEPRDYERAGTITRELSELGGTRSFSNRVVVQVGSTEGGMVDQSRWFADAARDAGMDAHFETYSGGHDYAWYRHGLLYAIDHLCP